MYSPAIQVYKHDDVIILSGRCDVGTLAICRPTKTHKFFPAYMGG